MDDIKLPSSKAKSAKNKAIYNTLKLENKRTLPPQEPQHKANKYLPKTLTPSTVQKKSIWPLKERLNKTHRKISLKKYSVSLALVILALITSFYFVSEGAQAAVTVDTSTAGSGSATQSFNQRKTWHDGSRYWMAFYSGTEIEFWYSADGTSWSQNTSATLAVATNNFSIEANNSYAFIAYSSGANVLSNKASTYPSTSFSWGIAYTALDNYVFYNSPVIARDTDNKIWVHAVAINEFGDSENIVNHSISANAVSSWGSQTALGVSYSITSTNINKLAGGDMLATWVSAGELRASKYTNNVGWSAEGIDSVSINGAFSSVEDIDADSVYLLIRDTSGNSVLLKKYTDKQGGDGVNINDASNATLYSPNTENVRDSSGNLFTFLSSAVDSKCHLWKSTDNGSSWAEQDSSDAPAGNSLCTTQAMAIDSSDTIHMLYLDESCCGSAIKYNTFSSGQYGTAETLTSYSNYPLLELAIDSNDKPHVVQAAYVVPTSSDIVYQNRVSGSWADTSVETSGSLIFTNPSISISEDNIPEIAYINLTDADLTTAVGNANNATSFTLQDVDTTVQTTAGTAGTSIGVDIDGNTWVAYVDENGASDYVTLVKHNDADGWGTWQIPVNNTKVGKEPSLAISDSTVYVAYQNSVDDVALDTYSPGFWSGEATLQTGNFSDVSLRWSKYHNYQHGPLDIVYSDGTDALYSNTGYWQNSIAVDNNLSDTSISQNFSEGKLYAFLLRSNIIYYSSSSSPYTSWSAPSSLYSTGTNRSLTSATTDNSTCSLPYIWTSGAGSPYDVKFDTLMPCVSPILPTLISPTNSAFSVASSPTFQLYTTDLQNDTIKYKINIHNTTATSGGNCSGSVFETADQNSSGTGWDNGTTAYASGATAAYTIQTPLSAGTGYCWQAQGKDPSGSNAFGPLSSAYTFTTSSMPAAPTLSQPANGSLGMTNLPEFRMGSSDIDADYLKYKIELCSTSNCSSIVRTIDQTSSQIGWIGQSQQNASAYSSASAIDQYAIHQYQPTALSANTQYWWRAYAIDPGGSNSWSSASSIWSFTTAPNAGQNQVIIKGNTNIGGDVRISP